MAVEKKESTLGGIHLDVRSELGNHLTLKVGNGLTPELGNHLTLKVGNHLTPELGNDLTLDASNLLADRILTRHKFKRLPLLAALQTGRTQPEGSSRTLMTSLVHETEEWQFQQSYRAYR